MKVVYSHQAQQDLFDIHDYIQPLEQLDLSLQL